jgi:hypothetical protein
MGQIHTTPRMPTKADRVAALVTEMRNQYDVSEKHLTINVMECAITRLELTDRDDLATVYETVMFWTGEDLEEWGTSDMKIAVEAVRVALLPALQQQLLRANLGLTDKDFGYHATDLYVVAKAGVATWLKANYKWWCNATFFTGNPEATDWNGAGRQCIDIPFAGYSKRD